MKYRTNDDAPQRPLARPDADAMIAETTLPDAPAQVSPPPTPEVKAAVSPAAPAIREYGSSVSTKRSGGLAGDVELRVGGSVISMRGQSNRAVLTRLATAIAELLEEAD